MRREPVLDDAYGAVDMATREAEAVWQQRHRYHLAVREGAQDGAVVDVEELDVQATGERVLIVGEDHEGLYGGGADRWSTLGLDDDGFAYLPVYPSRAEHTAAAVGCPVTMTGAGAESLFLQVTHVSEKPQTWHVSVNNPSLSATVTVRVADAGMGLAGLQLEGQTVTVPPGGMVVLL